MSLQFAEVGQKCESVHGCDFEPTALVWVDHHAMGCNYTGYRCDIHLNLLAREALTEMARVHHANSAGHEHMCNQCGEDFWVGKLSDHVRWFRL